MGNLWVPISTCFPYVKLPVENLWPMYQFFLWVRTWYDLLQQQAGLD